MIFATAMPESESVKLLAWYCIDYVRWMMCMPVFLLMQTMLEWVHVSVLIHFFWCVLLSQSTNSHCWTDRVASQSNHRVQIITNSQKVKQYPFFFFYFNTILFLNKAFWWFIKKIWLACWIKTIFWVHTKPLFIIFWFAEC